MKVSGVVLELSKCCRKTSCKGRSSVTRVYAGAHRLTYGHIRHHWMRQCTQQPDILANSSSLQKPETMQQHAVLQRNDVCQAESIRLAHAYTDMLERKLQQ
jgi:hypothetical protein